MNWYIVTKQKVTCLQALGQAFGNVADKFFGSGKDDIWAVGGNGAGAYDENPKLIIKPEEEYPDYDSIKSYVEGLRKDRVAYVVQGKSAEDAVQGLYMQGLLYSGERTALFAQCPELADDRKRGFVFPSTQKKTFP